MAKNKTNETKVSVNDFVNKIEDEGKRDDANRLIKIFSDVTGFESKMWGPSIIGFGSYHYKYDSGHEGDMALACFSPRKTSIVLYLSTTLEKREELLKKLGKHKAEGGCVYVKKLEDIDIEVMKKLIVESVKSIKKNI